MIRLFMMAFLVLVMFLPITTTASSANLDYWPTQNWLISTPEAQGMKSKHLVKLLKKIRSDNMAVDSVTIVRNGYLVLDAFRYPFQKDTPHEIQSCTKSITSTLIGLALDKGIIKSVDQPVLDFFQEKTFENMDDQKKSITLKHLLTMNSGLGTRDNKKYKYRGFAEMLRTNDWAKYVLDLPMANTPGKHFNYSNGVAHLLSVILQKTTHMTAFDFAKKHLFEPLNITDVKWDINDQGINYGFGHMMLRPHDMAKFGFLFLHHGQWENRQVLSRSWVKAATAPNPGIEEMFGNYGYQWWVDPYKYYAAMGYAGQFIFVVPKKNMVVVFTGSLDPKKYYSMIKRLMDKYIMKAAASSVPLKANPKENKKLDLLIAELASSPEKGFVWNSKEDGQAKEGKFIRIKAPAFQFTYPETSRKTKKRDKTQIMRMKTLSNNIFAVWIREIPKGMELSGIGLKVIPGIYEKLGRSDVQVISNQPMKLKDGTPAFRTDITFLTRSKFKSGNVAFSVFKEGKWVMMTFVFGAYDKVALKELTVESLTIFDSLVFQ